MRRLVSAIPLCALLVLAQPSWAGTEPIDACGAAEEFVSTDTALAQFAAAIAAGGPIDILAVGSATTVGSVTNTGEHSGSRARGLTDLRQVLLTSAL